MQFSVSNWSNFSITFHFVLIFIVYGFPKRGATNTSWIDTNQPLCYLFALRAWTGKQFFVDINIRSRFFSNILFQHFIIKAFSFCLHWAGYFLILEAGLYMLFVLNFVIDLSVHYIRLVFTTHNIYKYFQSI